MAAFEFDRAVRWARLDRSRRLARRPDDALLWALAPVEQGQALLLDTCVYVDQLQGRAPSVVGDLVAGRIVNHSSIALVELMHPVGRLDPGHTGTAGVVDRIGRLIKAMPAHRLFAPDIDTLGKAAILSGLLARLQGYVRDDRLRALHDCVLFLQAMTLGLTVLTRNLADYDLLLQIVPQGSVLFYRT